MTPDPPPRASCLWSSLLLPPTFIFNPSTPKLIENPAIYSVDLRLDALIEYASFFHPLSNGSAESNSVSRDSELGLWVANM